MAGYPETKTEVESLTDAELSDYYAHMEALESFAQAHKAVALASIAERESHRADGAHSLADWIATTGRHHSRHAHRLADTAEALAELPTIWARFAGGRLSFDQTYELCRFVTPKTDAHWAEHAPAFSANGLRRHACKHRKQNDDEDPEPRPNSATLDHDQGGDGGTLRARYDTASLARIEAALIRQADKYAPDTGKRLPRAERLAHALHDLVTAASPSTWADRATMVVHADLETLARLADRDADVDLPFPARICAEEARRLAESARLEVSFDNAQGRPIGIGRTTRNWPAHVYRRIAHRDGTCRWPGCNNSIGLQVHHEPPFPRGPTDTHHGILLCVRHHDHRTTKGFRITGNPEAELQFWRPDGTRIGASRPPLHPRIQDLF